MVDAPQGDGPCPLLVGFHGYAERADHMLKALRRIRAERRWLLVSVQALNRFYTKTNDVVANWMTREDRELAIADNITYVASVISTVRAGHDTTDGIVYTGFSQGVAMAYRAAAFAAQQPGAIPAASAVIALAGDLPPDVAPSVSSLPPVLIGRGTKDDWYTEQKAATDLAALQEARVPPLVHVFEGGHQWDDGFIAAAGAFLDRLEVP
jgi:predicted esterase